MPKYEVINEFIDLETKQRRRPGTIIEVSVERAKVLADKKLIKPSPVEEAEEAPEKDELQDEATADGDQDEAEFPKHIGGGYYLLSNGEKIKGKEKALEAERALGGE